MWLAAFALFFVNLAAAPSAEQLRVRVHKSKGPLTLVGMNLRIDSSISIPGLQKALISHKAGVWHIRVGTESKVRIIQKSRLTVRADMLRTGAKPIPESVQVILGQKSEHINVIARMNIEEYLLGVLPSEMPAHWPLEALKAQAVSARSFARSAVEERRFKHFDIDSTVLDQMYVYSPARSSRWSSKVARAVSETKNEVLRDSKGRVLKAFYSADCGCSSEDPREVWGGFVRDVIAVDDPTCGMRPLKIWQVVISQEDLRQKLGNGAPISSVQVHSRTSSGRVRDIAVRVEREGKVEIRTVSAQSFRGIFGYDRVRSTAFSLRLNSDGLTVEGSGFGHGVGLCQTGAKTLAENGKDYKDILKTYYPQAVRTAAGSSDET